MPFRDIIGQDRAIDMLTGALRRGRVSGAYLFRGEEGVGKRLTALAFAKALNCREKGDDACDECDSCGKIDAAVHPDVLMLSPVERLIRIDEIRKIDDALSFHPFEGLRKVIIVDDAESMNIAAANAFLKTLEEPPAESVIILISPRPDLLPPTIRSRCSQVRFSTLSTDFCREVIQDKVPKPEVDLLARLSMGRPGRALSGDLKEERTWFFGLLDAMMNQEKDGWASREDIERWLDILLTVLRDIAVSKVSTAPGYLVHADRREEIGRFGTVSDAKGIIDLYRDITRVRRLLMFNLNKSITWNYLSSRLRKELLA